MEPVDAGLDPARAAHGRTATARRPHVDEERRPEVLRRHAAEPAGHDAAWVNDDGTRPPPECRRRGRVQRRTSASPASRPRSACGDDLRDPMSGFAASLWCELMYLPKPSGAKHSAEFLP